jgi:hypothetical protein
VTSHRLAAHAPSGDVAWRRALLRAARIPEELARAIAASDAHDLNMGTPSGWLREPQAGFRNGIAKCADIRGSGAPRDDRRPLAEAVGKLGARVEHVSGGTHIDLDPPVEFVELLAVTPSLGPVSEADNVRRCGRSKLEALRFLDESGEFLRELAATRDHLDDSLAAQLLQSRPNARTAPRTAGFDFRARGGSHRHLQ